MTDEIKNFNADHSKHVKSQTTYESNILGIILILKSAIRRQDIVTNKIVVDDVIKNIKIISEFFHDKRILSQGFRDLYFLLNVCVTQILKLSDCIMILPYVDIFYELVKCLRLLIRSERVVTQILPLICATTWISNSKLLSVSANYIRLAVRYHPKIGSETVLGPLLNSLSRNKNYELMKLLFYIHSYNPIVFRTHNYGQLLLSIFSQPQVPVTVKHDCLLLATRILDDLPNSIAATKACFGSSMGDCLESLLVGGSKETGSLMSALMIKLAQRDIMGTMHQHANHQLPKRLPVNWPGCLEAGLSLSVALARDCSQKKHRHIVSTSNVSHISCIPGCLDAVVGYLNNATHKSHVVACLVALQDMASFIEIKELDPHKATIELFCNKFGVSREVLWKNIYMASSLRVNPTRHLSPLFSFRSWLNNNQSKSEESEHVSEIESEENGSETSIEYHKTLNTSAKYDTGSRSSKSSIQYETNLMYENVTNSDEVIQESNNRKVIIGDFTPQHSLYDHDNQNILKVCERMPESQKKQGFMKRFTISNIKRPAPSSSDSFSSLSENKYVYSEDSLSDVGNGVNSQKMEHFSNQNLNSSESITSNAFSDGDKATNYLNTVSNSSFSKAHHPNKHLNSKTTEFKNIDDFCNFKPTKSAPQLAFQGHDAIQHFHARYYEKLSQYIRFISDYLPFPIALTVQKKRNTSFTTYLDDTFIQTGHSVSENLFANVISSHEISPNGKFPSVILHFACSGRCENCLYSGNNITKCFQLKTRYPIVWMHLLVLIIQTRFNEAVPMTHPLMAALHRLWLEFTDENNEVFDCYAYDQSTTENDGSTKTREQPHSAKSRPASACGAIISPTTTMKLDRNSNVSKLRTWHSLRFRSKKRFKNQSSFFILATRSYPSAEVCDNLVKEIKEEHFYDIFTKENRANTTGILTSRPTTWYCFLCTKFDSNLQNRISNKSICDDGPINEEYTNNYVLDTLNPYLVSKMKIRHVKNVPRIMAWITNWQIHECKLKDGLIFWRKQYKRKRKPSIHNNSPELKSSKKRSLSQLSFREFRSSNQNANNSRLSSPLSEGSDLDGDWFCLPINEIMNVRGVHQKRKSNLSYLEIKTFKQGLWILKTFDNHNDQIQNCGGHSHTDIVGNCRQQVADGDQLKLWLRAIQIALIRAKQK